MLCRLAQQFIIASAGRLVKAFLTDTGGFSAIGVEFPPPAARTSCRLPLLRQNPCRIRQGFVAERKGFEPLRALGALHDFQSCALDQLSHLSIAARPNPNCKGNYNKTGEKCQAFFSKNQAHPNAAFRAQASASWRTKPHSSFSSVRFSEKALLRKTAYSSAIVAW